MNSYELDLRRIILSEEVMSQWIDLWKVHNVLN